MTTAWRATAHKTRLAVRRRLSAAATRRGWVLDFVRVEGESLIFQVRPR